MLGPLLFILYVNDIPDLVNSKVKMFADDIKIYTQIESFSDALSFQNDLDRLCGWAREWLLNQARAGQRPARSWFLKLILCGLSVCVCVCAVCPRPRLVITSGVMWHDIDLI